MSPNVVEPIPKAPHSEEVETRRKELVPRRARLLKKDFAAHGYTEGCPECRHMNTGLGHRGRGHSETCRRRMEVALGQEEEGKERLERGDERINKWMEDKFEEQGPEPHAEEGGDHAAASSSAGPGHATSSVNATEIRVVKNKGERERDEESRIIAALARGVDITEVFSPKRVTQVCKKYGLTPGESMDLSTGWDFDRGEDRRQAVKHIKEENPMVVIGSPPCTVFSQLQTMSMHTQNTQWMDEYEVRKQKGHPAY